jgi:hypothetical protein
MYVIVDCEEKSVNGEIEHSVSVVPAGWIVGDFCYFPSATKVKAAVKKLEPVNQISWTRYKAHVVHSFGR